MDIVNHHSLKSIGFEAAAKALQKGAALSPIQGFYRSGGGSYAHILTTKAGKHYLVSNSTHKALVNTKILPA